MSKHTPRSQSRSPTPRQPALLPSALPRDPSPRLEVEGRSVTHPELSHETSLESDETHDDVNPLEPFFVHVEDVHTSTTHHPTVRYIFSDDEGGLLTDKVLRLRSEVPSESSAVRNAPKGQGSSRRSSTARNRPSNERIVVVSLGPDGRTVESAHSLSGDWQVLGVDVTSAPTLEGEGEDGGLMLRIRGTGGVEEGPREGANEPADSEASLESVVANYRDRMEELKKILESGSQ